MKKYFIICLFAVSFLTAEMALPSFDNNQKIGVQNSILAQVNGTAISVIDIKKKMDMIFHQNYSHLEQSNAARYQFYETSWRHVLTEMIDHQLILADAKEKDIKLTDGEIREELEERFGPNIMLTLDKIGLSYNDAWQMVKDDLIVRRMTWWFVHMKALSRVTPQEIRQAFHFYLKENPAYQEWRYRVISLRGENARENADKIAEFLSQNKNSPESISQELQKIDPSLQISAEYTAKDKELSDAHKAVLSTLSPGEYSSPVIQKSKMENKAVARIFYLAEKTEHPAPEFNDMSPNLRSELTQKAVALESSQYLEKLRKQHGFDNSYLKETISDNFHPFSLE